MGLGDPVTLLPKLQESRACMASADTDGHDSEVESRLVTRNKAIAAVARPVRGPCRPLCW